MKVLRPNAASSVLLLFFQRSRGTRAAGQPGPDPESLIQKIAKPELKIYPLISIERNLLQEPDFLMEDIKPPIQDAPLKPVSFPGHLVEGYETFLAGRFKTEGARYRNLAVEGQKPRVMLIGCCDSRVSPEVIFDVEPGEIFTVRNVAGLVPPYNPNNDLHGTSAALEFGVMGLRVEHVVVMAHARCGGIKNYAEGVADPYQRPLSTGDFIGKWMSLIEPAAASLNSPRAPMADYVEELCKASVIQSIHNLRTFPWIATLEQRGLLKLHGAYFDILDALLLALNESTGQFLPVAPETHAATLNEVRF